MTVLLAFTLEHASRATGLPERRIRYWDDTDVLKPSLMDDEQGGAYGRIYSFPDLIGLQTISLLRDHFQVSLQKLRAVSRRLRGRTDRPWSDFRFYVSGRELFFRDPDSSLFLSAVKPSQIALVETLDPIRVARETEERAQRLVVREPDEIGRVERNRYVAGNHPIIAGTRIPTIAIWEFHEAGYDEEAILKEYPRLQPADIAAALSHERRRREARQAS